MDARVHIFAAAALGSGRIASPTLGRPYSGKAPVGLLILKEIECATGSVWTWRNEEKSPLLRLLSGSNPGRPARSPASSRLSHLTHTKSPYTSGNTWFRSEFLKLWTANYLWSSRSTLVILKKYRRKIKIQMNFISHCSWKSQSLQMTHGNRLSLFVHYWHFMKFVILPIYRHHALLSAAPVTQPGSTRIHKTKVPNLFMYL